MELFLRLVGFLKPYRVRLAVAVAATLLVAVATSGYAYLLGPLLKILMSGDGAPPDLPWVRDLDRSRLIWLLPAALVAVSAVRAGAQAVQTYLMEGTSQRVVADLRRALYGRFLSLPQAWHQRQRSGDLLARIGMDVQLLDRGLTFSVSSAVRDGATLLALLVVCAVVEWRLFLIALAAFPIAAFPLWRLGKLLQRSWGRNRDLNGALATDVGEAFANARVLQAFGCEASARARFDAAQDRYLAAARRATIYTGAYSPLIEFLGIVGLCAALYFAGTAVASHALRGEAVLSFLAAMMLAYRPIKDLSRSGASLLQSLAAGGRILEILDAPERISEPAEAPPPSFSRTLAFQRVTFTYEGGSKPALDRFSLEIPRGAFVALVGSSGSGKSTAAALLLRFFDPDEGAIQVDGRDVRESRLMDLRRLFAYVPQEPFLFAGTIRENLVCAREDADEGALVAALEAANALEFVRELPGGLDARLGERGAGLSGGQRQRLALARAFLVDAPIVLLDEATSALDGVAEAKVQEGLERLLVGRTAIVIAHRLSTVARADLIIVLSEGRIVERGRHSGLLAAGGEYAMLWNAQLGESASLEAAG